MELRPYQTDLVRRFFDMTSPDPETGCIVWTRARNRKGYGQIRVRSRLRIAHRLSWEMAHGEIPAGMMVLHRCDNPPCVNPAHLFLGTNSDNQKDSVAKGRHWMKRHPEQTTFLSHGIRPRGEQCRCARLTAESVREIRRLRAEGVPAAELAQRYGVKREQIYKIALGYAWRHVS